METNELQNVWKNIDSEINMKTTEELEQLLVVRTRKTINKFLFIFGIDIFVCIGLIIFLIITALNRTDDIIYMVNNSILCLITAVSLIVSLLSWNRLHTNKLNLSVKEWLEQRIRMISKWMSGKYSRIYILIIPVLLVMINLSIHVYYEYKPFLEVIKNKESIYGLIAGFIVGLFVSFYAVSKIRRYQMKNLEFLKRLYSQF